MYIEINKYEFSDLFTKYNREDNFSREARELLFEFFEDMGTSEPIDIIAICCDFNEDTIQNIINNYSIEVSKDNTDEDISEQVESYLQDNTVLIGQTAIGLLYQVF